MYGSPHILYLADGRQAVKAAIKRASKAGRSRLSTLDADSRRQLTDIYQAALADLRAYLFARAGDDNTIRLDAMRSLLTQAEARLDALAESRDAALGQGMRQAAGIGAQPFAAAGVAVERIADEALRFAINFTADDGLQLSSRIWNVDQHGREVITQAIQRHIIQGHSASQAAQEFLQRGEAIPANVQQGIRMADANHLSRVLGEELMTGQGSPYSNALRLFRTEINRAHGEAYQAAAFQDEDVIGTRFLLSPRHPEVDICDMHARVNRYGLGPGVYPRGKNPWPAHPNTLSFVEAVYADEISDEDRKGKEDRVSWLKQQPSRDQAAILGGVKKQQAFARGHVKEGSIATPWRVVKQRLQRRGINPDDWGNPPELPPLPPAPTPPAPIPEPPTVAQNSLATGRPRKSTAFLERWQGAGTFTSHKTNQVLQRFDAPGEITGRRGGGAFHLHGSIYMAKHHPANAGSRGTMRHETGHHIDHQIAKWKRKTGQSSGLYHSSSEVGTAAMKADQKHLNKLERDYYKTAQKRHPQHLKGRRFSRHALSQARHLDQQRFVEQNGGDLAAAAKPARELLAAGDDAYSKMPNSAWDRITEAVANASAKQHGDRTLVGNARWWRHHDDGAHMADLVGAITKNRIGWGHSFSYYRHRPGGGQQAEAFANVFDLLDYRPDGFERAYMEQLVPNYLKFVEDTLQEVIDAKP